MRKPFQRNLRSWLCKQSNSKINELSSQSLQRLLLMSSKTKLHNRRCPNIMPSLDFGDMRWSNLNVTKVFASTIRFSQSQNLKKLLPRRFYMRVQMKSFTFSKRVMIKRLRFLSLTLRLVIKFQAKLRKRRSKTK